MLELCITCKTFVQYIRCVAVACKYKLTVGMLDDWLRVGRRSAAG